ncbi:MAG: PaaI family thioesterase [Actinomycetota bacterium]
MSPSPFPEPIATSEPARGGYGDLRLFGLTGLEQLRTGLKFLGPRPPVSHLIGIWFDQIGEGTSAFSMPASPWLQSPAGVIPGGVLAMLADAPLGTAVHSALPPATAYTTAELSMTFLRPATVRSGRISAHGQLIHVGRSIGLSETFLYDEHERMLAHGTSRCYVFPPLDPAPDPPPDDYAPEIPSYDTPDPWERPVMGEPIPQEVWDRMERSPDDARMDRRKVAGSPALLPHGISPG